MKNLLHQLEAGVAFLVVMTVASWAVIIYELGAGLWALWALSIFIVYVLGNLRGAETERRRRRELLERLNSER